MSKLPNDIRIQIARKANSETWKIDELLEVIKVEIEVREASERIKTNDNNKQPSPSNRPNYGSASAFTTRSGESFNKLQCVYCKRAHYSSSCETIKNVRERKDILRQSGRCFNCIRKGRKLKDCPVSKHCRHCNKRHHQSICFSVRESSKEDKPGGEDAQRKKDDDKSKNESTVTTA